MEYEGYKVMCGIVGVISKKKGPVDGQRVQAMNNKMIHRGPDDSGIFVEEKVGFGHRRLSIVDLSKSGRQPMTSNDGRLVIVFNGEIYNYKELKEILRKEGVVFQNETDTEVIMEAYRHWGISCTKRFNGMWAFALYDKKERIVFFSRDRFGVKPLYVYENEEELVFASEIKCILEIYPQERIPNIVQLRRYMAGIQEDADENTFYANIKNFPKSKNMIYNLNSNHKMWNTYWRINVPAFKKKWATMNPYRMCRRLVEDAVRIRLRADVEVGASLSGGLDSSTIVSIVSKKYGIKMHTFSSMYEEKDCDEREFIKYMNGYAGSHAHYIYPDKEKDLIQDLKDMIFYHDGPCQSPSPYSGFCVYRGVGKQVKVMLDGQGADEIFGGYIAYYKNKMQDLMGTDGRRFRIKRIALLIGILSDWPQLTEVIPQETILKVLGARKFQYIKQKYHLLNPRVKQGIETLFTKEFWNVDMKIINKPDDTVVGEVNRRMNMDLQFAKLPRILHDVDRNSMARSIEVRLPFLDYRLVEFSYTLEDEQKIRGTWTKYILRRGCSKYLPVKIRKRKNKMGFPAPFWKWIQDERYQNKIGQYLSDYKQRGIVDADELDRCYKEQLENKGNYSDILFRCMAAEIWLQEEIDSDSQKWNFKSEIE